MRRVLAMFSLLAVLLSVSAASCAPVSLTRVTGQVVDQEGQFLVSTILVEDLVAGVRRTCFTDLSGRFLLELPKGEYQLTFLRSAQYEKTVIPLAITSRIPKELKTVTLVQLYDLSARGWYGGDLHQHTFFSDGADSPLTLLIADLAMGLDFGAVTDHNQVGGHAEYLGFSGFRNDSVPFMALGGVEVTSEDKGHFNVINTSRTYPSVFSSAEEFASSLEQARGEERFVQINHPSRRDILGFAYWEIIDRFDGMEIWNGKDLPPLYATNQNAREKWFELLNQGTRLTATASSDLHSVAGNGLKKDLDPLTLAWYTRGVFAGMPRTYVHMPELSADALIRALKAGKAFMTNGPLVLAEIAGKGYGESVAPGQATLAYEILNNEPLILLRIYKNGKAEKEIPLEGINVSGEIEMMLAAGDYVVLEAEAEHLGYALTNPIYCE